MKRLPPIADKQVTTCNQFNLWSCLSPESQTILRSFTRRGWKPPIERFVTFNIGELSRRDEGDYRNKLEMSQRPNDNYVEAR